jgi:anti-anti-sigma factor
MKIEKTDEFPSYVILRLSGNLFGGPHADDFYSAIKDLIEKGKKTVLVDLKKCKSGNSAGLGILIRGYITLKNADGTMRVFNCSEHVDKMFKVTQFNKIMNVCADEAEATAGL